VAQRLWRTEGSVDTIIAAPPREVYAAVADITRTGERSSECRAAEWLPGSTPGQVGSRFRGRNRSGVARWSRVCEVTANDPGSSFVFRTVPERIDPSRRDSTTWSYTLAPEGDGTRVTHSYEITTLPLRPFRALYGRILPHHRDMRPQMAETLAALKAALEG
jgi:polyketide cyclase/dehydrase/lipid transport protein